MCSGALTCACPLLLLLNTVVSSATPELVQARRDLNATLAEWYPAFNATERLGALLPSFAAVIPNLPSLASRTQFFDSETELYDYIKHKDYNRDPARKQVRVCVLTRTTQSGVVAASEPKNLLHLRACRVASLPLAARDACPVHSHLTDLLCNHAELRGTQLGLRRPYVTHMFCVLLLWGRCSGSHGVCGLCAWLPCRHELLDDLAGGAVQ